MCSYMPEHAEFARLVSDTMPLESFCEKRLLSLWKLMHRRFNLLHEELEYFIIKVMQRFVQVNVA